MKSPTSHLVLTLFAILLGLQAAPAPAATPTPAPVCFDSWSATNQTDAPVGRSHPEGAWTGSEMIVFGGYCFDCTTVDTKRYNPSTDSWRTVSNINEPSPRAFSTVVWTGTEMIVWGGDQEGDPHFNNGGRYNPISDTWTVLSEVNAPTARSSHSAVWTGSEMIIWGGSNETGRLNTGGKYNPSTDTWTTMSTINAPEARSSPEVVWTGSEMIVWGGQNGTSLLQDGRRYNPVTDTWVSMSTTNVPAGRELFTAVWTGSEMIVWGGYDFDFVLNTGGRYNPVTDSWTATSTINAPEARDIHSAVWTGSEMIVWGGGLVTGGRYNPGADNWTGMTTVNAPSGLSENVAVWTGKEMIVWGGGLYLNTGGRYCGQPTTTPTPSPSATPGGVAQAINLSTRLNVGTGNLASDLGIGGFIVTGTNPRRVIVRGIGPSLSGGGITALADPMLELHGPGGFGPVTNNNWKDSQQAEIMTTNVAPANELESAIVATLDPGAYTAILSGTNNGTGVGLVEVYDLSQGDDSKLANISTRAFVRTGNEIVIAGFILAGGSGSDSIIVRGLGPSISGLQPLLPDPMLELRNSQGVIVRADNNWQDDASQAAIIMAKGLAPTDVLESAIAATLTPGAYTALLSGVNDGNGVGLVEVYDLGSP